MKVGEGVELFGISTLVLIYFFIRFINKKYCNFSKHTLTAAECKRKVKKWARMDVRWSCCEKI